MRRLAFVWVMAAACSGSSPNGGDAHPDGTRPPPDAPLVTPPCAGRVGYPDLPSFAVQYSADAEVAFADFDGDGKLDVVYAATSGDIAVARGLGDGTLATPAVVSVGGTATSLNVVDATGDGVLDLVVLDYQAHLIRVFPGRGDGTFGTLIASTGAFAEQMRLADVTGDGRPDAVLANDGTVSVMVNSGTGAFAPGVTYDTGFASRDVSVTDLNGDGKPDVVQLDAGTSLAYVLLNQGDGTLAAPASVAVPANAGALAIGDVTGDGHADLVVETDDGITGSLDVFAGHGDGTFAAPASYASSTVLTYHLVLADVDSDGVLDAVAGGASISILRGDGHGFGAPTVYEGAGGGGAWAVALGDLDGDGKPELASTGASVRFQRNRGDGTFADLPSVAVGHPTDGVAVVDFDRDGNADLVATSESGLDVLVGHGDGTFGAAAAVPASAPLGSVAAGDVNGDGVPDLVALGNDSAAHVFLGKASGAFAAERVAPTGNAPLAPTLADLDGDGALDLVEVSSIDDTFAVLRGDGSGGFGAPVPLDAPMQARYLVVADFDGNGTPDVAVSNGGEVKIFANRGDATFAPRLTYSVFSGGLAAGDLDGDGHIDLVSGTTVLRGNGDGTFALTELFTRVKHGQVALRDLDGDGALDLLLAPDQYQNSGVIEIRYGHGDATFAAPIYVDAGTHLLAFVVGDVTGDHRPDILVTTGNYDNGRPIQLLRNTCYAP